MPSDLYGVKHLANVYSRPGVQPKYSARSRTFQLNLEYRDDYRLTDRLTMLNVNDVKVAPGCVSTYNDFVSLHWGGDKSPPHLSDILVKMFYEREARMRATVRICDGDTVMCDKLIILDISDPETALLV